MPVSLIPQAAKDAVLAYPCVSMAVATTIIVSSLCHSNLHYDWSNEFTKVVDLGSYNMSLYASVMLYAVTAIDALTDLFSSSRSCSRINVIRNLLSFRYEWCGEDWDGYHTSLINNH